VRLLAEARELLLRHQTELFERAGATRILIVPGREDGAASSTGSFGERLVSLIRAEGIERLVVMGGGAVPRLSMRDAERLVEVAYGARRRASTDGRRASTNNRYSSDVCAISDAAALADLPPLPTDNALPRWLEERAGFTVRDLPGRDRLALDLDTPLDLALLSLAPRAPRPLVELAEEHGLTVPRLDRLRSLAADPRKELLVFGRSGSRTLRWLERNVRCRVRFLAEERGLRASSALAIGGDVGDPVARHPRATLGRLLEAADGPASLASIVGDLADGAIIDSRVLMADRYGNEDAWPSAADRFASDLLRADQVHDEWLGALTRAAAAATIPILLGAHTLVGPGIPLLLRRSSGG